MGDHLVLYVDHLIEPPTSESIDQTEVPESSGEGSAIQCLVSSGSSISSGHPRDDKGLEEPLVPEEEESLIKTVECRICQEEDHINNVETPCACSGSLKFAHRRCVQRWCNEKGDVTCEICHQIMPLAATTALCCDGCPAALGSLVFLKSGSWNVHASRPLIVTRRAVVPRARGSAIHCIRRSSIEGQIFRSYNVISNPYAPGYTAPPTRANSDETTIDISGGWTISSTPLNLHDPRLLAMAAAERHFLEAEYEEYAAANTSGASFCRSTALILMALLLLRHALTITNGDGNNDDASNFFSLFFLRVAGFLLPCYIMAWAISILQRRRQRQEAAAVAATEVAFVLQSGQRRGLQFTIAPGPVVVSAHREPLQ